MVLFHEKEFDPAIPLLKEQLAFRQPVKLDQSLFASVSVQVGYS